MNTALSRYLLFLAISLLPWSVGLAADLKIGFVNAGRVLEEAPQAETARKQLEVEFAPRDQELLEMQKDLRKQEEKLARDGAVMSDVERRKLERDIVTLKRDVKRSRDEFREDFNIRRNEVLEKLHRRVREVIVSIAEKEKYDLIVGDAVIYASKVIDITDRILDQLTKESKANGEDKAPGKK